MKLLDKVAIVTGGGKGIGEEICLGLAKEGANIVIAEVDIDNANKVVDKIKNLKRDAIAVKTDVSDESSVNTLIKEIDDCISKLSD